MRAWCRILVLALAALPSSCAAPAVARPEPAAALVASPAASFDPAALFPASSSSATATVNEAAQPASAFHLVFSSPYPEPHVWPFDGGAVIVTHGLIVAVNGSAALQRAAWLSGLPEIVNWDADVQLALGQGAQVNSTLPAGTVLSVHAGNRHGPDESRVWDGKTWTTKLPGGDPRVLALYRDVNRFPLAHLKLPGNRELVVRPAEKSGLESLLFEPGGGPARTSPIASTSSGYRAWLIGPPDAVRLCLPEGEIFALRNGRWTAEPGARGAVQGCTATASGTLWMARDDGTVHKRVGDGWEQMMLPAGVKASSIHAGGERVWVVADAQVLSTERVGRELLVKEEQLPGEVFFGISGLDATGPDLLSVSADPAGPGTSACDSLAVVFGAKPGARERAVLVADAVGAGLELFEAEGSEGGTLYVPTGAGAQMKLRASMRVRKAQYLVPPTFEDGMRIVGKLRSVAGEPKPALVCAIPRHARKLGSVSSIRE